jgi:2,5-dihydroxypyridine 5,6-dioxygenase
MLDLSSVDLLDAFARELKLCKLKPDEHVVVLSEPTSRSDYVAAAFGAAKLCGAHVIAAIRPPRTAPTPARDPAWPRC